MTVRELIALLMQMPQDTPVFLDTTCDCGIIYNFDIVLDTDGEVVIEEIT